MQSTSQIASFVAGEPASPATSTSRSTLLALNPPSSPFVPDSRWLSRGDELHSQKVALT